MQVKGFHTENSTNLTVSPPEVQNSYSDSALMTQTQGTRDSRTCYVSKWNTLFDRNASQWISFKPKENVTVYPCYACRDMFGSKNSFLDHVNRRGMLIQYTCPQCPDRREFTFYNPCSFLLHARDHFSHTSGEIDLENVTISVLPIGLAGFFRHPDIPLMYNDDEDNIGETSVLNTRFYTPAMESEGNKVVILRPWILLFYQPSTSTTQANRLVLKQLSNNIPNCKFIQFGGTAVTPVNPQFNPNELFEKVDESDGEKPVEQVEENVSFGNYPKCLECNAVQQIKMTEHFIDSNKPINEKLKCSICKYIASTNCSLKAHERIHSGLSPYVCPECGKDFPNYQTLLNHLDDVCFHLAKHVRYRCPGRNCSKIFAASITFASHFPIHIQMLNKCTVCQILWECESDFVKHNKIHEPTNLSEKVYKCTVCKNGGIFNKESFLEHINMHCTDYNQRVYVFTCKFCKNYFRSRETYAVHLLRCSKSKKSGSKTPDIEETINLIDKSDEETKNEMVNCVVCNNQYSVLEIRNHLRQDHCKSEEDEKIRKPVILLNIPNDDMFRDDSSDDSKSPELKRRRKVNKSKKIEMQFDLPPEEPIVFDGTYYCKLCDYNETNRQLFHEHIIDHKDVSTSYQCMECGQCFVVKPSLIKHLSFIHQINDTETYFQENECYDKEAVKELENLMNKLPGESSEPLNENQCKICRLQFENDFSLQKHFRVHGMAFLMNNKNKVL